MLFDLTRRAGRMDWPFILLYRRYLPFAEETFDNRFVSYLTERQLLIPDGEPRSYDLPLGVCQL